MNDRKYFLAKSNNSPRLVKREVKKRYETSFAFMSNLYFQNNNPIGMHFILK